MAKNTPPKAAALGTQSHENAGPSIAAEQPLSMEERVELRTLFNNPVYRKAFSNARLRKPSPFAGSEALNSALGGQVANNRLHQIQGWDLFEAALAMQTLDPKPKAEPLVETFPNDPFFGSVDPSIQPPPAKPTAPKKP